jgi:hypothetical protein
MAGHKARAVFENAYVVVWSAATEVRGLLARFTSPNGLWGWGGGGDRGCKSMVSELNLEPSD